MNPERTYRFRPIPLMNHGTQPILSGNYAPPWCYGDNMPAFGASKMVVIAVLPQDVNPMKFNWMITPNTRRAIQIFADENGAIDIQQEEVILSWLKSAFKDCMSVSFYCRNFLTNVTVNGYALQLGFRMHDGKPMPRTDLHGDMFSATRGDYYNQIF